MAWKEATTKDFFTSFARDYGFDPLVAANWHPLTPIMLAERKVFKERSGRKEQVKINL